MRDADSGLRRRGLLLLVAMTALAGVVLFIVLRRPAQETPAERPHPEWLAVLAASPQSPFPANVAWTALPPLATALPSAAGWEIRYNAALALARRGSAQLPLGLMREMLDEQQQMRNFRAVLADGHQVADETAARKTVLSALKALTQWHQHPAAVRSAGPNNPALTEVYQAVDRLTQSPNLVVRTEAEKVRRELKKG
jgi:hypothetical protein